MKKVKLVHYMIPYAFLTLWDVAGNRVRTALPQRQMLLSWVGKLEVGGTDPKMEHWISGQGRLKITCLTIPAVVIV